MATDVGRQVKESRLKRQRGEKEISGSMLQGPTQIFTILVLIYINLEHDAVHLRHTLQTDAKRSFFFQADSFLTQ